jgi:glycosyltransferase involved in cell wall biosynthesis
MKLLFLVAEQSYFCTHRLNLGKTAKAAGFEVAVATRCQENPVLDQEELNHKRQIQAAGIQVFPLKYFTRSGLNPVSQWLALQELAKIYKTYSPDIVHHVGMKPVVLGTLIARWYQIPKIINALGGLGYLFTDSKFIQPKQILLDLFNKIKKIKKNFLRANVARLLNKLHSKENTVLILQNQDDIDTLVKSAGISAQKIHLIRGAGVDIQAFPVTPLPISPPIKIACVSRMLWDKGIGELVTAAKIIQQKKLPIQILLYGNPDPANPASITSSQLQAWHNAGWVIWKGYCADIASVYANCHIAVLPSYREGLPKSLLEAASCGRAIVTTDVPGCREVVQHENNGLLVPAQDAKALAEALITLSQDPLLQAKMGLKSRQLVEYYFSDSKIHQQTMALYQRT